jgi:ubiquinone/menaquinone biosynthesis C-methylase UbiE
MADYHAIYRTQAQQYQAMVAREDVAGNILPALQAIRPFAGLDILDMGTGTGRLACLAAPLARRIVAADRSPAMLAVAAARLGDAAANWAVITADHRHLPLADGTADLALAGWSFGHFVGWFPETWPVEIGRALAEMGRALRPGGTAVILETLGTGHETPHPPTTGLAAYYAWLEQEHRFAHTWIRTDYQFDSVDEAAELTHFFFGDKLVAHIRRHNLTRLPECTGIWWR